MSIIDHGCSMAGRIDLGHGKYGHCAIRNEPCPRLCLLKQIRSLEAQVQYNEISEKSMHDVYEERFRELTNAITEWKREVGHREEIHAKKIRELKGGSGLKNVN